MCRKIIFLLVCIATAIGCHAQLTLDYCIKKADENYPLIRRYDIVAKTQTIALSDINKQWLPSVAAYAQANIQNIVPEFPSALTDIMAQMGKEMRGLGKFQYKIGIDINQTLWDGGATKAQRETAHATTEESDASLNVKMYAMHEKVQSVFFASLLTSEQIAQQESSIALLEANLTKIEAMWADGTAMKSDADNIKAHILTSKQKLTEAQFALAAYREVLALYMGESIEGKSLVKPSASLPAELTPDRPELRLFDAQIRKNQSKTGEIDASVMPKFGFFAQTFYGYPGFNNFEAMMSRKLSFNILAGVKATWTINSLYSKRNSLQKIKLANETVDADRELFLFNTNLLTKSEMEEIEGIKKVMSDDSEIIALRTSVRKAAEAQLDNGVIDTFTLLSKITDENLAKLSATYHEIKLT